MGDRKKTPTMSDVAKLAGVSSMTVSRALKPDASVSEPTRQKILRAADDLNYILDGSAAGLSSGKAGFVAVTIPSLSNANYAETIRGLQDRLAGVNRQLLQACTNYDLAQEERLVEQFLRWHPEAIVVTGGSHTDRCRRLLNRTDVPVVEIWDLPPEPVDEVVGFSNAEAAKLIVHHFYEQNFRRIGYICANKSGFTRSADRLRGFVSALEDFGLDTNRQVFCGRPPTTMNDGARAIGELLAKWPDTEAVMCIADLAAFGAVTAVLRMGMSIPQDIAIAGFGAFDIGEISIPTITTVDVSCNLIGTLAAEAIIRRIHGDSEGTGRVIAQIEPRLVVRESSSKLDLAGPQSKSH